MRTRSRSQKKVTLSVIAPCYNEQEVLPLFWRRLRQVFRELESMGLHPELILVDDGSRDGTWKEVEKICRQDGRVRGFSFSRNFGHAAALTCGYRMAAGDAVVSMDCDLQDPPELIPALVQAWQGGAKIVYARRRSRREDTWFKRVTAATFYRLFRWLTGVEAPGQVGDFRLLDRCVVEALNTMGEKGRFFRGLVAWTGCPSGIVEFDRPERAAGTSKYPFRKMFHFAHRGISSFTTLPLYLGLFLGSLLLGVVALYLAYALVAHWFWGAPFERGWLSLLLCQILIGALLFLCIGLVGVYVAHLYEEAKERPDYLVFRKTKGVGDLGPKVS
jgi:dolichol-phosphate mannosyltransferase